MSVATGLGPLLPALIDQLVLEAGGEEAVTKVFCINGEIVEIPLRAALQRLPHEVMYMEPLMKTVIEMQGREATFLSPQMSYLLIQEVGAGRVLENINKDSVNMVSHVLAGKPVFGDDHDGVLRE